MERKRLEESLRESEEQFRKLVNSAPEAIIIQAEGRFAYLNEAAVRMYGAESPEDLLGRPILERIHPDSHSVVLERIRVANDEAQCPPVIEQKHLRLDGNTIHVEVNSVPITYHGRSGGLAFIRDITGRKRAEEQMLQLHRRNELTLNAVGEGIVGLDLDGKVMFANSSCAKTLGYSTDELVGVPFHDTVHHSRPDGSHYPLSHCLIHQTVCCGAPTCIADEVFWKKDGTSISVCLSTTPIVENGVTTGGVVTFRDITEVKRSEEARAKMEAQLHQAHKMEAIGTLAGGIAHDFNNILSSIIGYSDLALSTLPEKHQMRYYAEQILKSGYRARDLVKQILAFSRQSGNEKKPLKVHALIEETVKMLRASIPSTVEIRTNCSTKTDWIFADPTQIHQVIMNLCTNAWQAMRGEIGTLSLKLGETNLDYKLVAAHPWLEEGPYLKLDISDTGHGIPLDIVHRIFEPYFTTKERCEGTGLGLALVQGIVKDHGGMVTVSSQPGVGTTFSIFLPQIESSSDESVIAPTPHKRGNARILFVDDEPTLTEIGKKMLDNLGYQVSTRTSSIEALEAFRAQPKKFDLVITDLTMPKMTGLQLAVEIMKLRPGTPIIMCTGFSAEMNMKQAKHLGINALVRKPIIYHDLAEAVHSALNNSKAA